jgi:CBS domain containing-hemolysin-like protein
VDPIYWFLAGLLAGIAIILLIKFASRINKPTQVSDLEERIKRGPEALKKLTVKHVFTHFSKAAYVNYNATENEILQCLLSSKYSRYPVVEESFDNPVGVILAKDVLKAFIIKNEPFRLQKFLIPPIFLFEDQPLKSALKKMLSERVHMAFVVDEHGCVDGIVTLEDIIERLVGEIYDETDSVPEFDTVSSESSVIVPGDSLVTDLFDRLGLSNYPQKDETTVESFIKSRLGFKLKENEFSEIKLHPSGSPFDRHISLKVKCVRRGERDFFEISLLKDY